MTEESFLEKGHKTEKSFGGKFSNVEYSTTKEDIENHWDLMILSDECLYLKDKKVDVKGLKKINRFDEHPNENFHYVEVCSVRGGKKSGWLYGKADYFAFELNDYWLVVDKLKLQKLIEELVGNNKEIYERPMLDRFYRRKGRKDLIVMISSHHLSYIAEEILKK